MKNTRQLTVKKPWSVVRPDGYIMHGEYYAHTLETPPDPLKKDIMTQGDFLREFYPSGHKINSPLWYPDIYREIEEPLRDEHGEPTGKMARRLYKECVPRYAFAFEQIISLKQIIHLTGNDVQCDFSITEPSEAQSSDYEELRQGWIIKDMEIRLYEAVKSEKITADCAVVGYLEDGEFGSMALSFKNGDILYPHYGLNGRLKEFARVFTDYDSEGEAMTEWMEVWDERNLCRYKRSGKAYRSLKEKIAGWLGSEGWEKVEEKAHGFPFVPVAYKRNDDGPCWSASRDSIDSFDLSFSQMAHNNEAFGEPILIFQNSEGGEIDVQHGLNGTIKTLSMDDKSKASYLEGQSASESYMKQLDMLYKMIYEQSFTVIPPQMKSGDLPGVALKLLYSPAYEKAMADASEWQPFLNDMVRIFTYGYGVEKGKTIDYMGLPLKWWIKPYIHINESAVVQDLATAVQNGFISRQTASERNAAYSSVGEWDRIIRESKEEEKADLLYQIKLNRSKVDTAAPGGSEGGEE